MNKVVFPIIGVTFVVDLNNVSDNESIVKNQGCASYDVLVDLPIAKHHLVYPAKSSHSKESWIRKY